MLHFKEDRILIVQKCTHIQYETHHSDSTWLNHSQSSEMCELMATAGDWLLQVVLLTLVFQVACLFASYLLGYLRLSKLQSIVVTHMVRASSPCPNLHTSMSQRIEIHGDDALETPLWGDKRAVSSCVIMNTVALCMSTFHFRCDCSFCVSVIFVVRLWCRHL